MNLTPEQHTVVEYCKSHYSDTSSELVLINAIAGSGKTTLLTAIAKTLQHTNGLYICYNKSIATEAATKFPTTTACSTTHSLAYRAVVKQLGLRVGTFNYRSIDMSVPYEFKLLVLDSIKEFCVSEHLSFEQFAADNEFDEFLANTCSHYLSLMESGKIECSHDFYLKAFHIMLASGELEYPKFDFVMIDESGDVNLVTLAIFRLLPAKLKIAVGDIAQNIYSFNHTINAFEHLAEEGTLFNMTQSFRVSSEIASRIETFCQTFVQPSMSFKGVPLADNHIKSRAYITRTNAGLIAKMIELSKSGTPYSLVRKASDIFSLPLMVCGFKYQGAIHVPGYKHLQHDIDDWYEADVKQRASSLFTHLAEIYAADYALIQAMKLVIKHGKTDIMSTYLDAKHHEGSKHGLVLLTAHSAKGLEMDEVTIAPDLNQIVKLVVENNFDQKFNPKKQISVEDLNELNLAYVAASRARKALHSADFLNLDYYDFQVSLTLD